MTADDSGCTILHVDMDAFFASVEVRRHPELRGRPVVVGGTGPRGVVSSASYEARRFGVRSAMPGGRARRLCPQAIFLPPDMPAYLEASREVMAIFSDITPLVEPLSIDEAFLDVAGAQRLLGSPATIARQIKQRIATELGLTCTVGVAPTKFMAKLASTRAKPDGLLVVPADEVLPFLHPLPVEALWGVGDRTAEILRRLGLRLVGDVASAPVGMLRQALGEAVAKHLRELAAGRDPRAVLAGRPEEKSVSNEVTFDTDVSDVETLRRTLLGLSTKVGSRLRAAGQAGRTVAIKVRLADFQTLSRSRTLLEPTDVAREIFAVAWSLFAQLAEPTGEHGDALAPGDQVRRRLAEPEEFGLVRLLGVRVEGLGESGGTSHQPALDEKPHGWRDAEVAADRAAARFGGTVVGPASLLRSGHSEDGRAG